MARLCDADKMQEFLEEHIPESEWEKNRFSADWISRFIEISAKENADVVEVKHGYWEDVKKLLVAVNPYQHTCGICGKSYFDHNIFNYPYCPNCGAKMDGERKEK